MTAYIKYTIKNKLLKNKIYYMLRKN